MCGLIMLGLLAFFALFVPVSTMTTIEGPEPSVAECGPTLPNGATPPAEEPSDNHHGDGLLFTSLWPAGEILADPRSIEPDGSIGMKFPWWRAPGVGGAGDLTTTGSELTTGAAIRSEIPDGYGQPFQASGIYFPTEGCYQITARSVTSTSRSSPR